MCIFLKGVNNTFFLVHFAAVDISIEIMCWHIILFVLTIFVAKPQTNLIYFKLYDFFSDFSWLFVQFSNSSRTISKTLPCTITKCLKVIATYKTIKVAQEGGRKRRRKRRERHEGCACYVCATLALNLLWKGVHILQNESMWKAWPDTSAERWGRGPAIVALSSPVGLCCCLAYGAFEKTASPFSTAFRDGAGCPLW